MSKIVRIHQLGGPEVLQFEDINVGAPGPGELRIRVEAIGLNRSEAMFRAGAYLQPPQLPSLIGYEASGIVEALGDGVTGFAPGERVCVLPTFRLGEYGVYGEQAIVPARSVLPAPPGLSAIDSAAIWMQYLTAFGIVEAGKAGVGDFVLIPAASSSVGIAAIQIANWVGAEPIALTRHSTKADALRVLGAKHVVASAECDVVAEVMRITGGKGVNVLYDNIANPKVLPQAFLSLGEGGRMVTAGAHGGPVVPIDFHHLYDKRITIRGMPGYKPSDLPLCFQAAADGKIRVRIAHVLPLSKAAEAHRMMESDPGMGKIVLDPSLG